MSLQGVLRYVDERVNLYLSESLGLKGIRRVAISVGRIVAKFERW